MLDLENVELSNFPDVDEIDRATVKHSIERFLKKIYFRREAKLYLNFKDCRKTGLRKKHEIHAKLIVDGKSFFASAAGWKLLTTIQETLDKLKKEVAKKHLKR